MPPTALPYSPASRHTREGGLQLPHVSVWAQESLPQMTHHLGALVTVNSGTENLPGVSRVQGMLADGFSALGLHVEYVEVKERAPILRARTKAALDQAERLVLVGHADTVFGLDSSFQNFSIEGDKAYGPGAYDMKAGLVIMQEALRALDMMGMLESTPMEVVDGTNDLLQRYIKAGKSAGVPFVRNGRVGGTSDGNLATAIGIPTLDALGPRGGGAHTHGEFVVLSSMPGRLAALVHFLSPSK